MASVRYRVREHEKRAKYKAKPELSRAKVKAEIQKQRQPESEKDVDMDDIMDDFGQLAADTGRAQRFAPVRYLGKGLMQCTFLKKVWLRNLGNGSGDCQLYIPFDGVSSSGVASLRSWWSGTLATQVNLMATQSGAIDGLDRIVEVNRIVPFNFAWFECDTNAYDIRVQWDVVRIPVLQFWNEFFRWGVDISQWYKLVIPSLNDPSLLTVGSAYSKGTTGR